MWATQDDDNHSPTQGPEYQERHPEEHAECRIVDRGTSLPPSSSFGVTERAGPESPEIQGRWTKKNSLLSDSGPVCVPYPYSETENSSRVLTYRRKFDGVTPASRPRQGEVLGVRRGPGRPVRGDGGEVGQDHQHSA